MTDHQKYFVTVIAIIAEAVTKTWHDHPVFSDIDHYIWSHISVNSHYHLINGLSELLTVPNALFVHFKMSIKLKFCKWQFDQPKTFLTKENRILNLDHLKDKSGKYLIFAFAIWHTNMFKIYKY